MMFIVLLFIKIFWVLEKNKWYFYWEFFWLVLLVILLIYFGIYGLDDMYIVWILMVGFLVVYFFLIVIVFVVVGKSFNERF